MTARDGRIAAAPVSRTGRSTIGSAALSGGRR